MSFSTQMFKSNSDPLSLDENHPLHQFTNHLSLEEKSITTILEKNDHQALDMYLQKFPDNLGILNSDSQTLVHFAASLTTFDMLNVLYKHIALHKQEKLLLAKDRNGNTPLHLAAKNSTQYIMLSLLQWSPTTDLQNEVATSNQKGQNVLDMAFYNDNHGFEVMVVVSHFIFQNKHVLPLNIQLNPEEILAQFPEAKTNPELKENLLLGCRLVNEARKIASHSDTHPQSNHLPFEQTDKLHQTIEKTRSHLKKLEPIGTTEKDDLQLLKNSFDEVKKTGVANCHEFTDICLYLLYQYSKKAGFLVRLTLGDHVFAQIGNDPENQVGVDAWSGKVFPMSKINENIRYFKSYGVSQNSFYLFQEHSGGKESIHFCSESYDEENEEEFKSLAMTGPINQEVHQSQKTQLVGKKLKDLKPSPPLAGQKRKNEDQEFYLPPSKRLRH